MYIIIIIILEKTNRIKLLSQKWLEEKKKSLFTSLRNLNSANKYINEENHSKLSKIKLL